MLNMEKIVQIQGKEGPWTRLKRKSKWNISRVNK
jgi:hypothetical protein